MSENGFMAIVRKNPVTIGIVTFAVLSILIIVIVMIMKKNNTPKPTTKEGFSFSDTFALSNMTDEDADHIVGGGYEENGYEKEEDEIVENFPQPAPMNVMYSDANGNLATTTDLGVEYITVTRDSIVKGDSVINGKLSINGWSNVKDTLSDIYARIAAVEGRVSGHDTSISSLSTRTGDLERRVGGNDTSISGLSSRAGDLERRVGGNDSSISGLSTRTGSLETRTNKLEEGAMMLDTQYHMKENKFEGHLIGLGSFRRLGSSPWSPDSGYQAVPFSFKKI